MRNTIHLYSGIRKAMIKYSLEVAVVFFVAVGFFSFPVQMSTWLELIFGRYFFMPVVLHTVIFFSAQTVNIRLLKILKIIIC